MAHIHQINLSGGGVPKRPVPSARVLRDGIEGDWQTDRKYHGGPERAVSLFAISIIERLQREGHPTFPGSCGENITLDGVTPEQWGAIVPGCRLVFDGGVELEIASYCAPCSTIRASFKDSDSKRIKQELHPGESRLYARVVRQGSVATGEAVTITPQG